MPPQQGTRPQEPSGTPSLVTLTVRTSAVALFFLLPLVFFYAPVQGTRGLKYVNVFWDSILHLSMWPIIVLTCCIGYRIRPTSANGHTKSVDNNSLPTANQTLPLYAPLAVPYATKQAIVCIAYRIKRRWCLPVPETAVLFIVLSITIAQAIQSQLQVINPGWLWNPFLWGTYKVYHASDIPKATEKLCVELGKPFCLNKDDWDHLSSGMISVANAKDALTVEKGIEFARQESGGLVVNIMSRDTIDSIPALRLNMEGLKPFFSRLSVVVFENDSKDGSREAFYEWSKNAEGYDVDIMECEEAPGCKFHESHRYESSEAVDYFKASAIGPMAKYRQRMIDYVLNSDKYKEYSHVLVMDLDIGVSLSPFGVLHSLGLFQDKVVASASRQVWPGSFGTLIPPYDFAPFRAVRTPQNEKFFKLNQRFCELSEPGDRWRNQCDSVSPLHLIMILSLDRSGSSPYRVESAFNGATLYPLNLIRERGAMYDAGEDGQRCEHVGFNAAMKDVMYINPKWRMHLLPDHPGGPDGEIAMKNIARIVATPKISFTIFFGTLLSMIVVVYSAMSVSLAMFHVISRFVLCNRNNKSVKSS